MRQLLALTILVTLSACQCIARVTVSGSLKEGVVFHAPPNADKFIGQGELHDLTVTMVGSNNSTPVWHIKGKARTTSLTYGTVPPGMNAQAPARPLEPGHTYVIHIKGGSGLFTPPCNGGISFAIGPDGTITSCYEEESRCG
jgi:hypothetical protein